MQEMNNIKDIVKIIDAVDNTFGILLMVDGKVEGLTIASKINSTTAVIHIEKANSENVNYIVMGTHGRTGISHVFMGSTAEYIIRHATKPIFVIPMNTLKH